MAYLLDSIPELSVRERNDLYERAIQSARTTMGAYTFDESSSKNVLTELYRYEVEWHRKMALPVSILIFFLIGAPLGAIIRKGGLGMPIVVSVAFFVVYYIVTITGEKMAREGTWSALRGIWFASWILFPIAIYLTYKATNDSNLLNSDWYILQYKRLVGRLKNLLPQRGERTQKQANKHNK